MRIRDKSREAEFFQQHYKTAAAPPAPQAVTATGRVWRFICANPRLLIQLGVVIAVMAAERTKLNRRMDDAGQAIDKMRGIADILTGTIESVKTAAEAPARIGQVLNL